MELSLSQMVKVKLTEYGINILEECQSKVNEMIIKHPELDDGKWFDVKPDGEGYTEFYLRDLMIIFGSHLSWSGDSPFDSKIILVN